MDHETEGSVAHHALLRFLSHLGPPRIYKGSMSTLGSTPGTGKGGRAITITHLFRHCSGHKEHGTIFRQTLPAIGDVEHALTIIGYNMLGLRSGKKSA